MPMRAHVYLADKEGSPSARPHVVVHVGSVQHKEHYLTKPRGVPPGGDHKAAVTKL